ncbi:MAG: sigma-70 family RNA polymerase sigma factor [Vicinamibacterales bacterium]
MPPSDLYSAYASTIEAALAQACRANRLAHDAADEFRSWARLRLLDNDQAVLRKFEGRSTLRTFLITVVQRLYLDWRNAEWGKWRPSAEARRLGVVAVELERMVTRDRLTYDEAAQTLAARGVATVAESDATWRRLPRRPSRRRVDEALLAAVPGSSRASDGVDADEAGAAAATIARALTQAMQALPADDQVLLQLRYWGSQPVSRIAAMTGEDQKLLYRRFDRIAAHLRRTLEAQGVDVAGVNEVAGLLAGPPPEVVPTEIGPMGPSTQVRPGEDHD